MKQYNPIVFGNWKAYMLTKREITAFFKKLSFPRKYVDVGIAPSFIDIPLVREHTKRSVIQLGAQGLSAHAPGAHTGEVTINHLQAYGVILCNSRTF